MKLENLSKEWRNDLHLDNDEHDSMMSRIEKQFGANDSEIKEKRKQGKRERIGFIYLTGHNNRAAAYSFKHASDSLSSDDRFLMLLIYARLRDFNLLPRHMDKRTELLPLLGALAKHFDTCEAFDASISSLKDIIHAYTQVKQVQKYAGAEKLLLSILSNYNNNVNNSVKDCCNFIKFLNVANDIFLSSKTVGMLENVIYTKGITTAHHLLAHFYSLKYEMKVNGNDSEQDFIEMLERTIKYAEVTQSEHSLSAFKQPSSEEGVSMLQGLQIFDFMLRSEPTPPTSPIQGYKSGQASPSSTIKEEATSPSSPRLFSPSLRVAKEKSLSSNIAVNSEPEKKNLSMSQ